VPLAALCLHHGKRFTYVYNFIDHWVCNLRFKAILPLDSRRHSPICCGGKCAGPLDDCGGAWGYLQLVDQHHVPLDAMAIVATALERMLEADDQTPICQVMGGPEIVREAVDQLDSYRRFQLKRFDRRQINAQLHALTQDKESFREMHDPGGAHDRG
jgi:hypothetical protein